LAAAALGNQLLDAEQRQLVGDHGLTAAAASAAMNVQVRRPVRSLSPYLIAVGGPYQTRSQAREATWHGSSDIGQPHSSLAVASSPRVDHA
jgi:hypothetical protein